MRKSVFVFLLMVPLLISGCSAQSNESEGTNSKIRTNLDSFPDFLRRFKSDSVFQFSRIKFPLIKETFGDMDEKILIMIDTINWSYLSLKHDSSYTTRKLNAYNEKMIIKRDSAHLLYQGIDNGINVEFIFAKINNKWYLSHWTDFSY